MIYFLVATATVRLGAIRILYKHNLPWQGLCAYPMLGLAPYAMGKVLPSTYDDVLFLGSPFEWIDYGEFFALGILLYLWRSWLEKFTVLSLNSTLIAGCFIILHTLYPVIEDDEQRFHLVRELLNSYAIFAAVHLVLGGFERVSGCSGVTGEYSAYCLTPPTASTCCITP